MAFLQEFDFADCRFFAFCGDKFSQIWISVFTALSQISGKFCCGICLTVLVYNTTARGCNDIVLFIRFYIRCTILYALIWTADFSLRCSCKVTVVSNNVGSIVSVTSIGSE